MPDPRDSELFGVFSEQKSLAGGANYTVGKDGAGVRALAVADTYTCRRSPG